MNKHVIDSDQLHLAVSSRMNFSYNWINNRPKIFSDLVESIVKLATKVPNGILVIFPSYRIINNFKDALKENMRFLN